MEVILTNPEPVEDPLAHRMLDGIGGFPASDRPLFLSGYHELCRVDPAGGRALEICGGAGKLAAALASVLPQTRVTGLDFYVPEHAAEMTRSRPNLDFIAGDAYDLGRFPDESLDLVWGQAALHHLSHDLGGICREVLRVLKPGGRLVFIFEPMGHNLLVAAIRAVRMARHELGDECNLYLSQFRSMAGNGFSRCEVQMFNLFGYPMKAMSDRFLPLCRMVHRLDRFVWRAFPGLLRYGANANIIFTK